MKVKELIKALEQYQNQDADINILCNLINVDDEQYDVEHCNIDLWQQDIYCDSYDIMVYLI